MTFNGEAVRLRLLIDDDLISMRFRHGDDDKFRRIFRRIGHLMDFHGFHFNACSRRKMYAFALKKHLRFARKNVEELSGVAMVVPILGRMRRHFFRDDAQIIPLQKAPAVADRLQMVMLCSFTTNDSHFFSPHSDLTGSPLGFFLVFTASRRPRWRRRCAR